MAYNSYMRTILSCWLLLFVAGGELLWAQEDVPGQVRQPAGPGVKKGVIQTRSYHFKEADKEMNYVLYVPRSYESNTRKPLVLALHGLGSTPGQIMRYPGLTRLAEQYGFIVVAPWGYNTWGWYGSLGQNSSRWRPENLGALSEQDVMNVLGIIRKEFLVDEQRIYLLGHSMGGGGAFHLASKYPDIWAGIGTVAPAVYGAPDRLAKLKHLPVIVVQGDQDKLVSVKQTRRWVQRMKELKMDHVYLEVAGGGHIYVAFSHLPKIMEFLSKQVRQKQPSPDQPAVEKLPRPRSDT